MQNVIWVDEDDNILGIIPREKAHTDALLHRIAVVYVVNEEGKFIIQERTDTNTLDHSAAGHVDPGEEYLEAATRELKEELGISNTNLEEVGAANSEYFFGNRHMRHKMKIFLCHAKPGKINKEEVRSIFWADPHETYNDMKVHPKKYTGGFKSSIEIFLKHSN